MSRRTVLIVVGAFIVLTAGLWWQTRASERATVEIAALRDTLTHEKEATARYRVAWRAARAVAVAKSDGVTVTRTAWKRVTDTLIVSPVTKADTLRALAQLPGIKRAGDALADSAAALQRACDQLGVAGDTALAASDRQSATQDRLIDRYRTLARGPRLTGVGTALYDPLAHTPAASVQLSVRVVGDWSVIARADQRFAPGESPRGYVGVSHPLF